MLIFDIKRSAEGNYIQETGEKSQQEGYDYYEILPEDQVPRGMAIEVLDVDEDILGKYHYTNKQDKEKYIHYDENEDSNSEDNPYNDYPDESDDGQEREQEEGEDEEEEEK